MTAHAVVENASLGAVVVSCWVGAIGMLRMKDPFQALHYLSVPATAGMVALTLAVYLANGADQAFWKTLLILVVLFAINSVATHATARAFRARQLGHWEPKDGDPMEFVRNDFKNEDGAIGNRRQTEGRS